MTDRREIAQIAFLVKRISHATTQAYSFRLRFTLHERRATKNVAEALMNNAG